MTECSLGKDGVINISPSKKKERRVGQDEVSGALIEQCNFFMN
jgi:hypothetical protein